MAQGVEKIPEMRCHLDAHPRLMAFLRQSNRVELSAV